MMIWWEGQVVVIVLGRHRLGVKRAEEDYGHRQGTGKKVDKGLKFVERN